MIRFRRYYYFFSASLIVLGVASLALFGLRMGTDFAGGSLLEVEFSKMRPTHEVIRQALIELPLGDVSIRDISDRSVLLRFREIDEAVHQEVLSKLRSTTEAPRQDSAHATAEVETEVGGAETVAADIEIADETSGGQIEEKRFDSIGPIIGKEIQRKSFWAIGLVLAMIVLYVTWAFRKISYPLGSFCYGIVAVVALFHDLIITVGIFALLGHIFSFEIGVPFVAAILTILGYSVNDTIVVFDRIRENLARQGARFSFEDLVNTSVNETFVRSSLTSFSVLLALGAVLVFGGETVRYFILTLLIGVIIGTYSSIFIASPLLVSWNLRRTRSSR